MTTEDRVVGTISSAISTAIVITASVYLGRTFPEMGLLRIAMFAGLGAAIAKWWLD